MGIVSYRLKQNLKIYYSCYGKENYMWGDKNSQQSQVLGLQSVKDPGKGVSKIITLLERGIHQNCPIQRKSN